MRRLSLERNWRQFHLLSLVFACIVAGQVVLVNTIGTTDGYIYETTERGTVNVDAALKYGWPFKAIFTGRATPVKWFPLVGNITILTVIFVISGSLVEYLITKSNRTNASEESHGVAATERAMSKLESMHPEGREREGKG